MAAVEKWTCFGERQLFSERTQFLKIFALELEFRFQPTVEIRAQAFLRVIALEGKLRQRWTP